MTGTGGGNAGMTPRQILSFRIEGELYGVDTLQVQEIRSWERPTRIPNAPLCVVGAVNIRGAIVPVIDLRTRFGLPRGEVTESTVVIVVRVPGPEGERIMGMVVDAVADVLELSSEQLVAPPAFGADEQAGFVESMADTGEATVMLVDVKALADFDTGAADGEAAGPLRAAGS